MEKNFSIKNLIIFVVLNCVCSIPERVFAIDPEINAFLGRLNWKRNILALPNNGLAVFPNHELTGLHGQFIREIADNCNVPIVSHHGFDPLLPWDILDFTDRPKKAAGPLVSLSCIEGSKLGEAQAIPWSKLTGKEAIGLLNYDGRDLKIGLTRQYNEMRMFYQQRCYQGSTEWIILGENNRRPQWAHFYPDKKRELIDENEVFKMLKVRPAIITQIDGFPAIDLAQGVSPSNFYFPNNPLGVSSVPSPFPNNLSGVSSFRPRPLPTDIDIPRMMAKAALAPSEIAFAVAGVGLEVASENYGAPWSKTAAVRRQMEAYDHVMTHGIPATGISALGYVPVEVTMYRRYQQSVRMKAEDNVRRQCGLPPGSRIPGFMVDQMMDETYKLPKGPALPLAP